MAGLTTNCPKCKKPGVRNDTCPSCGVMVSRYLAYLAKKEQAANNAQTPANAPSAPLRPTGPLIPILVVVVLLSLGYFGYQRYYGGTEETTAPSDTSAASSGDTQAAPSPDEKQPSVKAPGLADRILAWFSGEQKPVPAPAAAKAPPKATVPSNIMTATDANFEDVVLRSATPVVVMFWANNNGPCQMTDPHFAKLADEFAGRIKFVKMNVETSDKTTDQYKVVGYPTLIYFENGEVKNTEVDGGSYWRIWIDLGLPGEPPKTDASKRTLAVNLIYTTTQDFEDDVLKSSTPVIVEFNSSIHLPGLYNLVTPGLTKLAAELNGRVKVVRLDVAECHNLTEQYNIGGFPAFVLFENGSVTKKAFADAWPADNIADKIKEELGLQNY